MKISAHYIVQIFTLMAIGCSDAIETASENKLDVLPPTTISNPPSGTYPDKLTVTLICSDDRSGCDNGATYFSTDPFQSIEEFTQYSGEMIPVLESTTLRFYSIDKETNIEKVKSEKYVIDYAPVVVNDKLNFNLSDNTIGLNWEAAIDQITEQQKLKYQLYYSEQDMTTVDEILSLGTVSKTWQSKLNAIINIDDLPKAKEYIWQVLVKDSFGNKAAYTPSRFSLDSATIPNVKIINLLGADLMAASELNTGLLKAFISINNGDRRQMSINIGATSSLVASINLTNMRAQLHQIEIIYEFAINNESRRSLAVAQVSVELDLSNGLSQYEIPNTSKNINFDDDKDNVNNLNEILINSNPFDFPFWVWMSGHSILDSPGNYGLLGVVAESNIPPARSSSVSWINSNKELCMFGGSMPDSPTILYGQLNDLWCWDGINWIWKSGSNAANALGNYGAINTPNINNVPGARKDAISWIDITGQVWLFGGVTREYNPFSILYFNDLWLWDGSIWTWKSGSNKSNANGTYGILQFPDINNVPGARSGAVSWVDSKNQLWLFGGDGFDDGTTLTHQLLNDLWFWDGGRWVWVSGSKIGNALGIYGTQGASNKNNVPGARTGALSWVDNNDNLWLFGGFGYDDGTNTSPGLLNDLWRWDGNAWVWVSGSQIAGSNGTYISKGIIDAASVPGARKNASAWIDSNNQLWLFGGFGLDDGTKVGYLNDLWRWDGNNWIWESGNQKSYVSSNYGSLGTVNINNVLGARSDAVSWTDSNGKFWLFGGLIDDGNFIYTEFRLNDLWRLEP